MITIITINTAPDNNVFSFVVAVPAPERVGFLASLMLAPLLLTQSVNLIRPTDVNSLLLVTKPSSKVRFHKLVHRRHIVRFIYVNIIP